MHVHSSDVRPPSMLDRRDLTAAMVIGGAAFTLLAHASVPLIGLGILALLSAGGAGETPPSIVEEHVVEARFVQLGKKPDPKKLPQRRVPRKSTAPDKATVVSKDLDPPKPNKRDAGPKPIDPEDDLLTRLGDRAKAFAEIAEEREREGDPEGLEDGTETEAREGDLYLGKLVSFFKRGWTIPSTLGDTSGLSAHATVEITRDLHVGPYEIVKSSGEPLFDQSIEDRFEQLRTQGTTLPEPPPEVAETFLGKSIKVRFHGKAL